jgi:hypothetical protein
MGVQISRGAPILYLVRWNGVRKESYRERKFVHRRNFQWLSRSMERTLGFYPGDVGSIPTRASILAYARIEDRWAASSRHYYANKRRYLDRNARRMELVQRCVIGYLLSHPCIDCGEDDPVVLDFDHVRGEKKYNIAQMVRSLTLPIVLEEIAKCDVRCANCHRRKTYGHCKKFQWVRRSADRILRYERSDEGAIPSVPTNIAA